MATTARRIAVIVRGRQRGPDDDASPLPPGLNAENDGVRFQRTTNHFALGSALKSCKVARLGRLTQPGTIAPWAHGANFS